MQMRQTLFRDIHRVCYCSCMHVALNVLSAYIMGFDSMEIGSSVSFIFGHLHDDIRYIRLAYPKNKE